MGAGAKRPENRGRKLKFRANPFTRIKYPQPHTTPECKEVSFALLWLDVAPVCTEAMFKGGINLGICRETVCVLSHGSLRCCDI